MAILAVVVSPDLTVYGTVLDPPLILASYTVVVIMSLVVFVPPITSVSIAVSELIPDKFWYVVAFDEVEVIVTTLADEVAVIPTAERAASLLIAVLSPVATLVV